MKSSLPNINLRVFRREKTDLSLLYNCSELANLFGNNLVKPKVFINNTELEVTIQKAQAKDASSTDICIFIDYKVNNLNSEDKYDVELRFYFDSIRFISYNIAVEGAGIIPSLKDNKQMFVQSFAFDTKKKRWVKPTAVEGREGEYRIFVIDEEVISLLTEIKNILKSKS